MTVQGRRLRNANFCSSCQHCCFEHGLSWINSNHRSSKCWTPLGCSNSEGLEVKLISMFTDKPFVFLPSSSCCNLESSLKHQQDIMEDVMKGGWMGTWTIVSSPMWYSPLVNVRQRFPSFSSLPLIHELTPTSCQRICCRTLVEWYRSMTQGAWKTDAGLFIAWVQRGFSVHCAFPCWFSCYSLLGNDQVWSVGKPSWNEYS